MEWGTSIPGNDAVEAVVADSQQCLALELSASIEGGGAVRPLNAGADRRRASALVASVLYRYYCRLSTMTLYEYATEYRPPAKPMARC